MTLRRRNILSGLLASKCPKCRQGDIFTQKGIFPLKTSLHMREHCNVCDQKLKTENNYGQGMNFVFIIAIFILTLCWYWPLLGLSYMDNSVFYYIGIASFFCIVLQPWLMRFTRVLFLYLVINYDSNTITSSEKQEEKNTKGAEESYS